jgi:hypothetical protein
MNSQTFGEYIKLLRNKQHYSLSYLGEQIDYSPSFLQKIENNQQQAPERIIEPLARVLGADSHEFMVKYLSEKIYYGIKDSAYAREAIAVAAQRLEKEGKGTQRELDKERIIQTIQSYLATQPIDRAWIFGSFAKSAPISYDSDIDLLVQFQQPHKLTLFDLIEMKDKLSEKTGREIDFVEAGQELLSLRESIHQEKILVYAR